MAVTPEDLKSELLSLRMNGSTLLSKLLSVHWVALINNYPATATLTEKVFHAMRDDEFGKIASLIDDAFVEKGLAPNE